MSAPNLKVWLPFTQVKLSDHWKLLPVCGRKPSKLLPNAAPPLMLTYGTPVRFAGKPGVIPPFPAGIPELARRALIGAESDVPVKQKADAVPVQESVTRLFVCGFRNPCCPCRM